MGVSLAAGHLSDKEDRVWGRRNNSSYPEGLLASGLSRRSGICSSGCQALGYVNIYFHSPITSHTLEPNIVHLGIQ